MSVGPDYQKPLSYYFAQKREGEFQALPLGQTELSQGLSDIVLPRVSAYLTGGAQKKDQVLRGKYYYESRFSHMRKFLETVLDPQHLQESYVAVQKNKDELVVWSQVLPGSELHITLNKQQYEVEYNLRRCQPEKPEFYPDSPVVLVSQPQPDFATYALGIKRNRHDEPFDKSRRFLSNQGKIPDNGLEYLRTLDIAESTMRAVRSRGSALPGEQESGIQSVPQFTKPVSCPLFDDQSPYGERRMEMLDAVRESLLAIEASHVTMEETTQAALQVLRRNRNQVKVIEETGKPVAKDAIDTVGIQIGKDTRLIYVVTQVDQ
ncbi:MAG TPA: hypothetical protein VGT05_04075 [Patescibacteria group bacterium]|nr:hypothetical protein [Patescibacteria group bacterium]